MATYNTGNPLGSTDPKDLYDNAQAFDSAVNSTSDTFQDRFGENRPTLKYLESEYPQSTQNALAALQARNEAEGFALSAEQDADRAEVAVDNISAASGNIYASIGDGLAGTVDGDHFWVVPENVHSDMCLYKNENGDAVLKLEQANLNQYLIDEYSIWG